MSPLGFLRTNHRLHGSPCRHQWRQRGSSKKNGKKQTVFAVCGADGLLCPNFCVHLSTHPFLSPYGSLLVGTIVDSPPSVTGFHFYRERASDEPRSFPPSPKCLCFCWLPRHSVLSAIAISCQGVFLFSFLFSRYTHPSLQPLRECPTSFGRRTFCVNASGRKYGSAYLLPFVTFFSVSPQPSRLVEFSMRNSWRGEGWTEKNVIADASCGFRCRSTVPMWRITFFFLHFFFLPCFLFLTQQFVVRGSRGNDYRRSQKLSAVSNISIWFSLSFPLFLFRVRAFC